MTFKKNDKRKSEASHRSKVVLNENTAFVANESYKALRTNVIFTVPMKRSAILYYLQVLFPEKEKQQHA